MESHKLEPIDRRVLSVPAGKTHAIVTEHNVYSCPESHPPHDVSVNAFAPRNEHGRIPRLYRIAARIVTNPKTPTFPPTFDPEHAQNITSYISVARLREGILDDGGNYRFYILSDIEQGGLKHAPRLEPPGASHVYLSLKELVKGSPVVHAIGTCK